MTTIEAKNYVAYHGGIAAPTATFLEDIYDSIQDYVQYLIDDKFNILVTKDPEIVINQYKTIGNKSLYSFDTKMDNVPQMIHGRPTHRGASAGPATIGSITNDGEENHIDFCAALSEYDDIEEANTTYKILEENGQKIHKIHKENHGNIEEFEKLVILYKKTFELNYKPKIMEEYFSAIEKSYGDISRHGKDYPILTTLLGYFDTDAEIWSARRADGENVYGEDTKERIEALRYIKEGLMSALGPENISEQADWMYEKRGRLNGKSAWDMLETGRSDDLRAVAALVNRVLG